LFARNYEIHILVETRLLIFPMKFKKQFYRDPDVTRVAKRLLGKLIYTNIGNKLTGGRIVEVEAYCGAVDRASHAYKNKLTERTKTMFEDGGICYVYLCYGIHNLFNIVTNTRGKADAVLVRAVEPVHGIDYMMQRRHLKQGSIDLTSGPGKLTQALGIERRHNGLDLTGNEIWIEKNNKKSTMEVVEITPRIGVDYAGPDAILPWRFYIRGNKWVSKIPN